MKVAELTIELHTNRDVTINGVDVHREGVLHFLEEKVFSKQFTPDQQWRALCELKQMTARMEHAYNQGRIARGEITEGNAKLLGVGTTGVSGTILGRLGR